ncbi:MAG: carboxylesterase family protein [Actinomyces sp.]|uniref:carboxylesterase/lipase family protein n=1 Tax=Actinomyces sp. TaxID=29317 RepID=UPI0026DD794F|nr:carboxylesterase family protein [Actinomyces sp.]MDO4243101.1 carboxylesterase family protein [Actinomyces sp.]
MTSQHTDHVANTPLASPARGLDPVVEAPCGPVRGVWREVTTAAPASRFNRSAAFYGVPYAEAPVGPHRFMAPVPRFPWSEVLDATRPGASPQQTLMCGTTAVPEAVVPGEDTLNLNIFTPTPGQDEAALPVLVWIHGGGFETGTLSSPWYDGATFNRDGVVTVSVSYRLAFNGFGYVEGSNAPVNRGLYDQITALRWVRDNIRAFGGDPDRVTLAGYGAGGASVMALLTSPMAEGLFSRAICQSGVPSTMPLELARERADHAADLAGTTADLAGWRRLSDEELDAAAGELAEEVPLLGSDPVEVVREAVTGTAPVPATFGPVHGDEVLPVEVEQALASGAGAQIPLLTGATAHEAVFLGFLLSGPGGGPSTAELLDQAGVDQQTITRIEDNFPELSGNDPALLGAVVSYGRCQLPLTRSLRARAAAGSGATWVYSFARRAQRTGVAAHWLDLPFVFDCLGEPGASAAIGDHGSQDLATAMHADWVSFVAGEDPSWAAWGPGGTGRVYGAVDGVVAEEGTPLALAEALLDAPQG